MENVTIKDPLTIRPNIVSDTSVACARYCFQDGHWQHNMKVCSTKLEVFQLDHNSILSKPGQACWKATLDVGKHGRASGLFTYAILLK